MNPYFARLVARYPDCEPLLPDLERAFGIMHDTFADGGQLLLCGNGGSAADCEHIAAELINNSRKNAPSLFRRPRNYVLNTARTAIFWHTIFRARFRRFPSFRKPP